jgi:septal ring factor EnvC (AmiA/AmiB activator)
MSRSNVRVWWRQVELTSKTRSECHNVAPSRVLRSTTMMKGWLLVLICFLVATTSALSYDRRGELLDQQDKLLKDRDDAVYAIKEYSAKLREAQDRLDKTEDELKEVQLDLKDVEER